jgi:hypothetical protein
LVETKSVRENPLTDALWTANIDGNAQQDLTPLERSFFTDPAVNTAQAKHAAAVLLANMRRIKAANRADHNHELNQAAGDTLIDKNQTQINALITTMTPGQIKLFQTYAAAHDAVTNHGNTDPEKVAMNVA